MANDEIPAHRRMKIGAAAKALRLSIGTLRNRAAAGELRVWQHPSTGFRYFDRDEIERVAEEWFGAPRGQPPAPGRGRRSPAHWKTPR